MVSLHKIKFFSLDESITLTNEEKIETIQQSPPIGVPKSGGYNLDFLDNLDDPNFNPFETKTKVVEAFGESNDVENKPNSQQIEQDMKANDNQEPTMKKHISTTSKKKTLSKNKETENDTNKEDKPEKPKKVLPPKPWLMKKSLKLKSMKESENVVNANDEFQIDILVPSGDSRKGNLRFSSLIC